jgi:predicted secreted protein
VNSRFFIPGLTALLYLTAIFVVLASTQLESAMKQMSSAYKELSFDLQQPHDVNKDHYLALVGTLKTEAQTSRGLVPKKAAALPPDQRAVMVKAYQKSMDDLIGWIDSLTLDIQNSQWDDARKVMAAIKQQMTYGHKDFRVKE